MHRPRSNTNTFAAFTPWRKPRHEQAQAPAIQVTQPIDELINSLIPPQVPSLSCARSLAVRLAIESPLPPLSVLNPILTSLCAQDSPPHIQSAGYDILSAYLENNEASHLAVAERLSYFSLFPVQPSTPPWLPDLWESRFKALRVLTKWGKEVVGIEVPLINLLKFWIQGAFDGLLETCDPERERSIDLLSDFLFSVVEAQDVLARIPEEDVYGVLRFYAGLTGQFLNFRSDPSSLSEFSAIASSTPEPPSTPITSSSRSRPSHKRRPSSLSVPSSLPETAPSPSKRPTDLAVSIYLRHLSTQMKNLSPGSLSDILPLLFRVLAHYASPLPRLSVNLRSRGMSNLEEQITVILDDLFAGPCSAVCMAVLKSQLPPPSHLASSTSMLAAIQISVGGHRTLRNYIRKRLRTRLARAYISRETSISHSPSGAPGRMDVERELMESAWPKDDFSGWDARRVGRVLSSSVRDWVAYNLGRHDVMWLAIERILDEVTGILKDVLQELDTREDNASLDDDEAIAVGETLRQLATYIPQLRNRDNTLFVIPLSHPTDAPTPFLCTLSSLLSRDHAAPLTPPLSTTLLSLANHLTDAETAKLPVIMFEQHALSPTSPEWLTNWRTLLLANPSLLCAERPSTRMVILNALKVVYHSVRDMVTYRKPLATLVWQACQQQAADASHSEEANDVLLWRILADEIVLHTVESDHVDELADMERFIELLVTVAAEGGEDESDDGASIATTDTHSPSVASSTAPSTLASPIFTRAQADLQGASGKDKEPSTVMSLWSSLATGPASRSRSSHQLTREDASGVQASLHRSQLPPIPRAAAAAAALIAVFTQLALSPYALHVKNLNVAIRVYRILINLLEESKAARTRLTILQFLVRLRADRDHRLYYVDEAYDPDDHILALASLVNRVHDSSTVRCARRENQDGDSVDRSKARPLTPQARDGRRISRGRGIQPSRSEASRSRSRATNAFANHPFRNKSCEALWQVPEILPFVEIPVDTPSEALTSYDSRGSGGCLVLPVSEYMHAIVSILECEHSWDILCYVLCHLPVQLANKHLFCGPKSRLAIVQILTTVCAGILSGKFASDVARWPVGLKARDAQGLAYHTLSVLISYQRCFDLSRRHVLVEAFQIGLNGQPSTVKCCLHALTLSAFELQPSMIKYLSGILEKLSQIMSNPDMAVHILGFLSVVGSLHSLHANFRDSDFKVIFGVALQYLQHHNRPGSSPTISWALSQHVRILSYYILYVWFLAVRLPDRPRHVRFITRQLLLANDGNAEVDDPTEVCFDWLARYTYASADPRPANSLLNNIVATPDRDDLHPETVPSEKAWMMGYSIITVRTLAKSGWIEVLVRRPSGFTKFLCRAENVPMVRPGDVDPDFVSGPAGILMERECPTTFPLQQGHPPSSSAQCEDISDILATNQPESDLPRPDPITGYVWSGLAPSQRRKNVVVDPAYFPLQLSAYPGYLNAPYLRRLVDTSALPSFFRTLDRIPVIDTHKVGIMYVAPGQSQESEILRNTHGSPAYTRFLDGIGRLISLREQGDVYAGGLNPDEDGEYAYAWWDDIGQILYHAATMMPSHPSDDLFINKKRHIGNDYVRIIWNDSGIPYDFNTLATQFQFVNIVIEPHSLGTIAAFSNNIHESEYFKLTIQRAPGMTEFAPVGDFKLISAENLPLFVRQLSLLADWFASIFERTQQDTARIEMTTNWHARLQMIKRLQKQLPVVDVPQAIEGVMDQEAFRDFTTMF